MAANAMSSVTVGNPNFKGKYKITIKHLISNGYELQTPIVEDGVTWETERQGSPSKLMFKVFKDNSGNLNFQEGDEVFLHFEDSSLDEPVELFSGFIFTKKRNKDNWIEVTAYDLLRYLKNKYTYVYTNKKASDIVKMVAEDFKLPIGTVDATNYVIGSRVEDNQTLFDVIQNALDLTLISTNKMYVLYADKGKLHLRDINSLKTNVIINQNVAENFDYTSSIDEDTYNEVELYYDNDETNKREYYNEIDETNVGKWGRLRYTESINSPTNAKERAKQMLKLYNRKTRKLKINGAFGDYHCRAGASVIVQLGLGDINVSNYMIIEKAKHTFKDGEYRMDLTLSGNSEFVA